MKSNYLTLSYSYLEIHLTTMIFLKVTMALFINSYLIFEGEVYTGECLTLANANVQHIVRPKIKIVCFL